MNRISKLCFTIIVSGIFSTPAFAATKALPGATRPDTKGPVLQSFKLNQNPLNTSISPDSAGFVVVATDASGLAPTVNFPSSPSQLIFANGSQRVFSVFGPESHIGNDNYLNSSSWPIHSAPGEWIVEGLLLVDAKGNESYYDKTALDNMGFPTSVDQLGSGDNTAPSFGEISFDKTKVKVGEKVTVTALLTDDLAGIAGPGYISSPSQISFNNGNDYAFAIFESAGGGSCPELSGTYSYELIFNYPGDYSAEYTLAVDQVGNAAHVQDPDLPVITVTP